MQHALMVICILVAITLPRLIHGRPAIDNSRSVLSMVTTRASKLADLSDCEQKAASSYAQGSSSVKLRIRRSSDHRLSELETLMTMSKINSKRSPLTGQGGRQLDPARIGRRRRFATKNISMPEGMPVVQRHINGPKHDGNPLIR